MTAYYNENDPHAAAWLRERIKQGHIAPGAVDERSIREIDPTDLVGFAQVHLFAGIGVWSYALRLAGWPDDRSVWAGSCPCQPFSAAGKRRGAADDRHLWPEMFRLIEACRPECVIGEQVASKDGLAWLDSVFSDLEDAEYACGAVDTCAAGFGAPHIRQRLYWMAYRSSEGLEKRPSVASHAGEELQAVVGDCCVERLADDSGRDQRRVRERGQTERDAEQAGGHGSPRGLAHAERQLDERDGHDVGGAQESLRGAAWQQRFWVDFGDGLNAGGLADSMPAGRAEGRAEPGDGPASGGCESERLENADRPGLERSGQAQPTRRERDPVVAGGSANFWSDAVYIPCRDGKARPTQPGIFPLAHGAPARVVRLRGYGNAIVAPQAAAFIQAVAEII